MKIINLVEDTKGDCCDYEHGLSFYIETRQHRILMDCGATDMFLRNAERLGVDLGSVDLCVLSHGHYDHSGGLMAFAAVNPDAEIYLREGADGGHYRVDPTGERYIGIDPEIMKLPKVHVVRESMEIDQELFLMMDFPAGKGPRWSNSRLKRKEGESFVQDEFFHEQCLVIRDQGRSILLSGCAHNGILNILDRYQELFGAMPDVVISGFHMTKKSTYAQDEIEEIQDTARRLLETGALFYTGHCTSAEAFDWMKEIMGDRLLGFHSGSVIA